uniref:Uncharacterized protein n=1 Tax=Anguilla anguilla TaxID=7936 RepID=A0A0E9QYV4_ANGAN
MLLVSRLSKKTMNGWSNFMTGGSISKPVPSCCEATVLPTAPPCTPIPIHVQ